MVMAVKPIFLLALLTTLVACAAHAAAEVVPNSFCVVVEDGNQFRPVNNVSPTEIGVETDTVAGVSGKYVTVVLFPDETVKCFQPVPTP